MPAELYRCPKHQTLQLKHVPCDHCLEEQEYARLRAAGLPVGANRENVGPMRGEHIEDVNGKPLPNKS